ncbi:BamA/TamA family outer membrane protein [Myroides sp. LJL115]
MQKIYLCILVCILFIPISTIAQTQDSLPKDPNFFKRLVTYFEEAQKDKSVNKFDLSFIGGPSYSPDTKLGIGIMASGQYRLDKTDFDLPRSGVSIYASITTNGFHSVGIENTSFFPQDKYRVYYDMKYSYMPTQYYGIGYEKGQQGNFTKYDEYQFDLDADLLRKIMDNTYVGINFSAHNYNSKRFEDPSFVQGEILNNTAIGVGYLLSYDSRDFIPNPYKGVYLNLSQVFYTKLLGSTSNFSKLEFTSRFYKQIRPKTIIAFDFNAIFNNGQVPWSMLSKVGGARQMRGYYLGQYRDKKQLNTQVELRQNIFNRHGIVLWAGAGNVFNKTNNFRWNQTLTNYGIGYRWEFKNRINIRLDYGLTKGHNGFYFNINESF